MEAPMNAYNGIPPLDDADTYVSYGDGMDADLKVIVDKNDTLLDVVTTELNLLSDKLQELDEIQHNGRTEPQDIQSAAGMNRRLEFLARILQNPSAPQVAS
ncbi:hypothetical protein HMPREF9946_03107 [Acetobacteraceae bacterium AT-5844]|nr:hypothetical protein HMPREF9946_03107 [Acetobacteraceae bacterium AT-5844]